MEQQKQTRQRAGRHEKEQAILFLLVEHYLKTGKPVGSQTLQEEACADVSPATIRNYFVHLEQEGYIKQQHLSGGRIPQSKAYVEYAKHCFDQVMREHRERTAPLPLRENISSNDVVTMLQQAADALSTKVGAAIAVSSPRFDHDVITGVSFVFIDVQRALAVITTEFGLVHTAVIYSVFPLSHALLKKADRFARSRLFHETLEPDLFEDGELDHVRKLYQEAMAGYFVGYSSVSQEDLWRTGFSRLIHRPEFEETHAISASLSLFENVNALRGFSRDAVRSGHLRFWIGDELVPYIVGEPNCAVVAIPYCVGDRPVGSLLVIGSMSVFYRDLFRLVQDAASQISSTLSDCLLHHRMTYRMPEANALLIKEARQLALELYQNPENRQGEL
jgi:heat-inducible transcriptional repressor